MVREIEITLVKQISTEDIANIFSCAFMGGIDYWGYESYLQEIYDKTKAELKQCSEFICYEYILTRMIENGNSINITDIEDDDVYSLTIENLISGIKMWFEDSNSEKEIEDIDSEDADMIIQYALFGEIIYG